MINKGLTYFEQHFFYSSKLLRILVDLRPANERDLNFQWILFCTTNVYICPGIVYQFFQLSKSEFTMQSAIQVLQRLICAICMLSFYSAYYFKSLHLQHCFSHIKYDYEKLFHDDEFQILEKYKRQSKIYIYSLIAVFHSFYIVMLCPCFFNICLYFFTRTENIHLKLPVPINVILNSGPIYYCFLIYETTAIYILTFIGSMCYSIPLMFVQHSFCQFSLLSIKIGQPFRKNKKHVQDISSKNKLHAEFNWIKDIINRHTRVIQFVDLINSSSKEIYLLLIGLAMFLIVLDFLNMSQLLSVWENKDEQIESIVYIIGSILVTYISLHVGQEIINHSTTVYDELCNVPFYTLSVETQKLLLFVIARSVKPCHLSIGDFFESSIMVFSSLMQKAFSFATVYYNVR